MNERQRESGVLKNSNSSVNISKGSGKNKKSLCPSEAQEAYALKQWADTHPICRKHLIHIPNGGSRNPREALNLKRQGVKPGVSDYFLAYPIGGYHGLWLELKRRPLILSRVSAEQKDWLALMNSAGYSAEVAWGWENARMIIKSYLEEY